MAQASQKLLSLTQGQEKPSIGFSDILTHFKTQSFGLLLVFLALPSALPFPAPGYSTPFGILLALLGLQLFFGRKEPWCPKKMASMRLNFSPKMFGWTLKVLGLIEWFAKPRFRYLHRFCGQRAMGLSVFLLACIQALPIPLTNTLPALIILIFGLGLLEEDGLLLALAQGLAISAIAGYLFVGYWISVFGLEGLICLKDKLTSLFY